MYLSDCSNICLNYQYRFQGTVFSTELSINININTLGSLMTKNQCDNLKFITSETGCHVRNRFVINADTCIPAKVSIFQNVKSTTLFS